MSENVGASTSRNPKGLHDLYRAKFTYLTMKTCWGVNVYIHVFLTPALAVGEWSASRPGRFTPWETVPGTHWIGGWVEPRASTDDTEGREILPLPGLELRSLGRPARSQLLYRIRYPGFQNNYLVLKKFTFANK
jgi:hypothetical protein